MIPQPHSQLIDKLKEKINNKKGCGGLMPQPLVQVRGNSKEKNKEETLMLGIDLGSQCHVHKNTINEKNTSVIEGIRNCVPLPKFRIDA